MARVFVSWGSPDESVVTKLVGIFRAAGVDLFEYTEAMRSGDQIHNRVLSEIRLAEVAVLCLSDQSVDREWVQRECHWCFSRLRDWDKPLKRLIVVEVAPLDKSRVPPLLKEAWLHRFSIHKHGDIDSGIGKLLEHVRDALGDSPPLFVPATIFAMTREQLDTLLLGASAWAPLRSLGQQLGMAWQEDPRPGLLERYGEHCLDFRPFISEKSLKDIVQETVNMINEHELSNRPIHVMWYSPDDLLEHIFIKGHHWEHFDSTKHMIFVDSVHPEAGSLKEIRAHQAGPSRLPSRATSR